MAGESPKTPAKPPTQILSMRPAYQENADSLCPSCVNGRKKDGKQCEVCEGRGYVKYT